MISSEKSFYYLRSALIPIVRKARYLQDRPDIDQTEIRGLLKDLDKVGKRLGIVAKRERRRSDDITE